MTVADDLHLHVAEHGDPDGTPLLLVNSLGTDLSLWDPQLEALGRAHRVVRTDTRGHGRSGVPPPPYTVEQLGADLVAVLDDRGVDRAHVVGTSLGGLTSIWLAARHPERLRRLVLANTAARIGTAQGWEARVEDIRAGGMRAVADAVVERFLSADFRRRDPATASRLRDGLLAADTEGYIGCCLALAHGDLRELAPSITAPTLVIAGTEDVATPMDEGRWLADAIPGARLELIRGAGHLASLEQPDVFADLVLDFLQEGP